MDVMRLSEISPWLWPDDAGETLLGAIRGGAGDEAERRTAIELASDPSVMDDTLAEALLAILTDRAEEEAIRGRAAIALGPTLEELDMQLDDFDEPDDAPVSPGIGEVIRDTLRRTYLDAETPKEVRRRALEAAVRAPADWHEGAVRAAFHDEDREWKLTAVFCMAYLRGFEEETLQALESEDPEIRYEAVHAAGAAELREAWQSVLAIVRDEQAEKTLRLAAIEAVAAIRPAEAAATLAPLADSRDPEIAAAVAEALAMAGAVEALDGEPDDEW